MLTLFLHIFITTMLPIFALVLIGVVFDKKFHSDGRTLSKINFFVLLPPFIFRALYKAHYTMESLNVFYCGLVIVFLLWAVATIICHFSNYDYRKMQIYRNCVMYTNCGNIGVAVATFIFSNAPYIINGETPYLHQAILTMVTLLVINNVLSNTLGLYSTGVGIMTAHDSIRTVFHMPMVYVVPLTFLAKLIPYDLTTFFLWPVVDLFASSFVAVSMITLGLQINRTPNDFFSKEVLSPTFARLIIGPIIAIVTVYFFNTFISPFNPIEAQTIIIAYAIPTAVNVALTAYELKNNAEFATKIVMSSTLLSSITLPIVILLAYYMYPVLP